MNIKRFDKYNTKTEIEVVQRKQTIATFHIILNSHHSM